MLSGPCALFYYSICCDIKWLHCLMFDARVHSFRFYKLFFREFSLCWECRFELTVKYVRFWSWITKQFAIHHQRGNSYVVLTFVFYVCPEFFHSRVLTLRACPFSRIQDFYLHWLQYCLYAVSILSRIEEWFQDIFLKKLIPKYDCVASSYVLQDFSCLLFSKDCAFVWVESHHSVGRLE